MKKSILSLLILCFAAIATLSAQQKSIPVINPAAPAKTLPALMEDLSVISGESRAANSVNYGKHNRRTLTAVPSDVKVISRDALGVPQWFSGELVKVPTKDINASVAAWFEAASSIQDVDLSVTNFLKRDEWTDELGLLHMKFDQLHKGIKVFDGEVVLHAKDGRIQMQNGNLAASASIPVYKAITITAEQARTVVKNNIPGYRTNWNPLAKHGVGLDTKQWEGQQVYYKHEGTYKLAYNYVVFANMAERYEYLVDAYSGEVLNHWSKICTIHKHNHSTGTCSHNYGNNNDIYNSTETKENKKEDTAHRTLPPPNGPATASARDLLNINRNIDTYEVGNTFYLLDGSRDMFRSDLSELPDEPVGAIWTIDIGGQSPVSGDASFAQILSNNNTWNDSPEGVSAHFNAGKAYEYFKNVHGRNAITGDGETIVSVVNVSDEDGSSLGNAFYNSLAIWYGNGDNSFFPLGRALDVAGHELSHGVIENTANLVYQDEPGAMNESFADIFGAMIDRDDWKIGEDVVRPGVFPGGALRSMSDPHNGAAQNDFGRGWQPRHMNERYTGQEDNGGVHLNSGIPNYAFFLFANQVGKERAEKVYYRALSTYLTRSSGFKELRYAVEQAANDLYGADVAGDASQAFINVGIGSGTPTNFEQDVQQNTGANLLLASTAVEGEADLSACYIVDLETGDAIFNPLSRTDHISKPSITDDGSRVIFVGSDNHIYLVDIDWSTNPPTASERIASSEPIWRNAVVSKDGNRFALLETLRDNGQDNVVTIVDITTNSENTFELKNPSYTQGVETDDVTYADAMEFDISGDVLMYDAQNVLESTLGTNDIQYWNIGFLEVWNRQADTWALGKIDVPLRLEKTENVGNPTYSKNSPYIIAFDVRTEDNNGTKYEVYGMNLETNEISQIFENPTWSFPNYSVDDRNMIFNYFTGNTFGIGIADILANKISSRAGSQQLLGEELVFGTWFTTGTRVLSDTEELVDPIALALSPVPARDQLNIVLDTEAFAGETRLEVCNLAGAVVISENVNAADLSNYSLDISTIANGSYVLSLRAKDKLITRKFVKL